MKLRTPIARLALSITAATLLPALAQAQHLVTFIEQNGVLTESSDFFSTVTWTRISGPLEAWAHPSASIAGSIAGPSDIFSWNEPFGEQGFNTIIIGGITGGANAVFSDTTVQSVTHGPVQNGLPQQGEFTVLDANGDSVSALIAFVDLGDSRVPEATNTLALFGLACVCLALLGHRLAPRMAAARLRR